MKYKQFILVFFGISILLSMGHTLWADQFPVVVEAEVRAVLSAERSGVLSSLKVDVGDTVKKGAVVGVVFHRELILKKEQREANRRYKKVQVENLTKLNDKGLVTDEELAKAKMELVINEKEISMIQTEIEHSNIRAPFSGRVVTRHIQPHEWVTPGREVVELYDPRKLRIVADIPADIAVEWNKGKTDSLYFPDLKKDIKAKLKVFSPQVDVRSNTIKVYWTVSNKERKTAHLLPGMKGVLKFEEDPEIPSELDTQ
ncbi:efflux RND transporter periplasmic adaptor subunit [Desulfonema magnum]|uniref:Efflux transporter, RND family n=1 Tax=Desulfonema magnum TaxID=45655 RepID=A0A975BMA8_9BACT|nr:efflux RND transporter periplasmic adaptor subunit [Desulfonema magnum]QTA87857.1 Efflux transporter, RND family [Desulfonema magnum]